MNLFYLLAIPFLISFYYSGIGSDSFAIGNYSYKPSMPFMSEQIPQSLSLAWFCLCDLHPYTLEKAIITPARKIDTEGKSVTLD